jgi:hypothetical protein
MIPRKGDIFECPRCELQLLVLKGAHIAPYDATELKCNCGEKLILAQSGSESAGDTAINKILAAAEHPPV